MNRNGIAHATAALWLLSAAAGCAGDGSGRTNTADAAANIERNRARALAEIESASERANIEAQRGAHEEAVSWFRIAIMAFQALPSSPDVRPGRERGLAEAYYGVARSEALLGHADDALDALEDAATAHFGGAQRASEELAFRPLRGSPRFVAALQAFRRAAGEDANLSGLISVPAAKRRRHAAEREVRVRGA